MNVYRSKLLGAARRFGGKRQWSLIGVAVLAIGGMTVALAGTSSTEPIGPVGVAAGFEDNDGNMEVDQNGGGVTNFDWDSFQNTGTWSGTPPYQQISGTLSGWSFKGIQDAAASTTDTGFAGGTKQDDDCPSVIESKAPNKSDLKYIYLAAKTVNGHTYLMLSWVRIPQNSTSASAHIGFEFNQGTTACPASSDGLVERTAGDLLLVYDFTGGSSVPPTISLSRWVTSTSATCQVGADSPPCWGTFSVLTVGTAEANVDTGLSHTCSTSVAGSCGPNEVNGNTYTLPDSTSDAISAPADGGASTSTTLGTSEFGEAGVDLTAAGVFSAGTCASFGQVEGISRSSGNSSTAAMEDLVGPGSFRLSNCGTVIIRKKTVPAGGTGFSFSDNIVTQPTNTKTTFSLNDGGNQEFDNVVPTGTGTYTVTETVPSTYSLTSIDCSKSTNSSGSESTTTNTAKGTVTMTIGAQDVVDCTYTNTLNLGAIKITKTSSKAGATPLSGATFEVCTNAGPYNALNPCTPAKTGSDNLSTGSGGTVCIDGLAFTTYYVTEKSAPTGYSIDDTTTHSVNVNTVAKCSDATFVGQSIAFTDTPLTDLVITATSEDQGSGGTKSTITCTGPSPSTSNIGNSPQGPASTARVTAPALLPGTYLCTVVVDP